MAVVNGAISLEDIAVRLAAIEVKLDRIADQLAFADDLFDGEPEVLVDDELELLADEAEGTCECLACRMRRAALI